MAAICEALNAISDVWASRIWAVVWQSTILVAAVALLAGLTLRRSPPSVRYWVWQILAMKILLMPFWTFAVPLPAFIPRPAVEQAVGLPAKPFSATSETHPPDMADVPTVAAAPATPEPTAVPDSQTASSMPLRPAWLFVGWMMVVVVQIIRLIAQRFRLARLLHSSTVADVALAGRVAEMARELGLRKAPQVVLTDTDCSPFACGIRRALIVLPRGMPTALTPAELRHVLLHELAHVKRHDLVWGWIREMARVVYFFHPVVRWICYRILLEQELACDAMAMALTGHNAGEYAATLVRVVSQLSEPTDFKTAAASASFGGETQ